MTTTNKKRTGNLLVQNIIWTAALLLSACPAKATVVLPTSNFSCITFQTGYGTCAGAATALPVSGGVQGVSFSSDGPVGLDVGGSTVTMSTYGAVSGLTSGMVIPLSYDFTISFDANISENWSLDFYLLDLNNDDAAIASALVLGSGLGTFSGATSWTTTGTSTDVVVETLFIINPAAGQTGELALNVLPGTSLDINAVPEPGSIGLLASGLVLLFWQLRKQRNTTARSV